MDGQLKDGNHGGLFAAFAGEPADGTPVRPDGEGSGGGGHEWGIGQLQEYAERQSYFLQFECNMNFLQERRNTVMYWLLGGIALFVIYCFLKADYDSAPFKEPVDAAIMLELEDGLRAQDEVNSVVADKRMKKLNNEYKRTAVKVRGRVVKIEKVSHTFDQNEYGKVTLEGNIECYFSVYDATKLRTGQEITAIGLIVYNNYVPIITIFARRNNGKITWNRMLKDCRIG